MAICICGREIRQKPHCPHCGMTFNYATPSRNRTLIQNNEEYTIRAFNCRACGEPFDDSDKCMAPPPTRKAAKPITRRFVSSENYARAMHEVGGGFDGIKEALKQAAASGVGIKLTRSREEKYKTKYGRSLSQELRIPIVEDPISQNPPSQVHDKSTLVDSADPGPFIGFNELDDQ